MKKILLLILLAGTAVSVAETAAAQRRVQLGVRAGVFMQDMELRGGDFHNTVTDAIDAFTTEGRVGFNVAVASRIRITAIGRGALEMGLFFQPEVIYSQNNYWIKQTLNGAQIGNLGKIRMQSVDIPLMVSFKISIIRAQAGPVFNVLYRNSTIASDIEFTPVRPLMGWTVGASVDIVAGLVLDGRYTGQFKDLTNHIKSGDNIYQSVRGSLSSWSLGLSYMF
jgi:hypothetical protein